MLLGCTDSTASTHAAAANTDDASCAYDVFGCMLAGALNFDSMATVDQGCVLPIVGCMTPGAKNYALDANVAAACVFVVLGCMSTDADNFDSLASTDDGSCYMSSPPPAPFPSSASNCINLLAAIAFTIAVALSTRHQSTCTTSLVNSLSLNLEHNL